MNSAILKKRDWFRPDDATALASQRVRERGSILSGGLLDWSPLHVRNPSRPVALRGSLSSHTRGEKWSR